MARLHAPLQQEEILTFIAFRKYPDKDSRRSPGVAFFSMLRKFTADDFFTSEIDIKYLGYIGSTYRKEFPGCPAMAARPLGLESEHAGMLVRGEYRR